MGKTKIPYGLIGWVILIFAFFSVSSIISLVGDYWWFQALGFTPIFMTNIKTKLMLFAAGALGFLLFAGANVLITHKLHHENKIPLKVKLGLVAFFAIVFGLMTKGQWFEYLQFMNQVSFNIVDPIFNKDVAFYIYDLPFFSFLWKYALFTILFTTIIVALDYLQNIIQSLVTPPKPKYSPVGEPIKTIGQPTLKELLAQVKRNAIVHLTILASLFFILLAGKHYLTQYSIMYSAQGIVVGAGYTDVVVYLKIVKLLIILAIIVTVTLYAWLIFFSRSPQLKKKHILGTVVVLYLVFVFIGPTIIPGIVQTFKVSPNELNLEKPFIQNNIEFTKQAYGLDDVTQRDFNVTPLTKEKIDGASETIENIRILDWRPLTQTYKQTQEIRLYYDLSGIDIDRYMIDGTYTQVMLAPRELDQKQIASNAQTWVNLHMVYTHGFGVVMSPVNSVTSEGLPNYLIRDIPPQTTVNEEKLRVTEPRIYYGEQKNSYVLSNTQTQEFDYPQGNTNKYIQYDGNGGVVLDSFMKKFMYALYFADIKILLSSDITAESKIMYDRNILDRVSKLTPFLMFDSDPYIVINNGRVYWIVDGYTKSGNYPYSQKFGDINYIRNSVKIVVDAYHGVVTYYIIDKEDPLMQTYANIYPESFKQIEELPQGLNEHLRYPVDLFKIQSYLYSTYHMNDPTVFYNKEDAWQTPTEIYGTSQKVAVEPYYVVMKLPEGEKEEFVLMTSFTPLRKDNMIAWLAARNDGDEYGKLLLYNFPKDSLVYGPLQIEAKFDQDSEISQQLTLWSQQGSRVTRGNLLVIPIEDSLIYIEPLYLQAEQGQLPQLKRVLVSDGERVVMEETLDIALEKLFGRSFEKTTQEPTFDNQGNEITIVDKTAQQYYQNMLEAMQQGDWNAFGENFEKLGTVLEE